MNTPQEEMNEYEGQLQERYDLLAKVEPKLEAERKVSVSSERFEELWEERADLYHDIGVYTVAIKELKEKHPEL